ncbi:hypothetical protein ATE84_0821 [Aquimarina sp. MAR_2010_214]|uniref:hypothetical protein n=1 Tax=Aquimarina sp. MAR_2010_214 TaxID=1250026 RepID=UPI000C7023B1|nr:hypothetical protein [Aquimarina sp. MAR_2010_214]PKV48807.1 hypothetical protein ATE84_0821 [Aquimarina sp. MAR_2010_214]
MKKYFLKSKGQFLKTSFALACAILVSIFLLTPLEKINANNLKKSTLENMGCTTGWRPVGNSCSCIANLCANYRTDRKYQFCGGMEIPTNEYRDVFTGFSVGCN